MIVSIAKKSDELFLFKLKNDIKVRKNSLKNKKISLSEHKKWFNKRLKEQPNILIFSKRKKRKIKYGQVRFDKNKKGFYEIDYSIIRNFRGKGLSLKMLKKALSLFPKKEFIAKVKYKNIISKKIFKKLKFNTVKKTKNYIIFYKKN